MRCRAPRRQEQRGALMKESRGHRFIGRTGEQAILRGAARSAARGLPRVVLVSGPAGMGKTTLVERFAERVAEEFTCSGPGTSLHVRICPSTRSRVSSPTPMSGGPRNTARVRAPGLRPRGARS
ncbi:ATP-binding protein [Streptomyces microflavus]|uniref:ATP-binding protein n=1 Tax=Streptomyces microflavus TaxID=1919 RepID=UPI0033F4936C